MRCAAAMLHYYRPYRSPAQYQTRFSARREFLGQGASAPPQIFSCIIYTWFWRLIAITFPEAVHTDFSPRLTAESPLQVCSFTTTSVAHTAHRTRSPRQQDPGTLLRDNMMRYICKDRGREPHTCRAHLLSNLALSSGESHLQQLRRCSILHRPSCYFDISWQKVPRWSMAST